MVDLIRRIVFNQDAVRIIVGFALRISGSVVTLVLSVLLVRIIGEADTGYFMLAFTSMTLLSAVARCGTEGVVLKITAAARADGLYGMAQDVWRKSSLLAGGVSASLALILYVFSDSIASRVFHKADFAGALHGISFSIVALSLCTLGARALQGWRRINASLFFLSVGPGLIFVVSLLAHPPRGASQAAQYYTAASILNMAAALVTLRWVAVSGDGDCPLSEVLRIARPLWIIVVVETLVSLFGQFIAGFYVSPVELTQLAISQRLGMVATIGQTAACQHAAPIFAEAWRRGDLDMIKATTQSSGRMACLLAAPIIIPMLVAPHFILTIYSPSVAEGALLLQISALGQLVNVATGAVSFLLMMCDREKEMRAATVAAGCFAVLSGWALTAAFGVVGAVTSSTLSLILLNVLASRQVVLHLGFHPIKQIFR